MTTYVEVLHVRLGKPKGKCTGSGWRLGIMLMDRQTDEWTKHKDAVQLWCFQKWSHLYRLSEFCTIYVAVLMLVLFFCSTTKHGCFSYAILCVRYQDSLLRVTRCTIKAGGTRWHSGWGTALQTGRLRDRFPMVSLEFFIDIILPAALWPWGWLSL
jgi:hypothetical protein